MLTSSPHGAQLTNTTPSERYFSYSFTQLGLIRPRHPVSQTCVAKFQTISLFVSRGSAIGGTAEQRGKHDQIQARTRDFPL
jgi:hypothetical protein